MEDDLLGRWTALVDHRDAAAVGRGLVSRWSEPHRRYHDVAHLRAVLDRIDELAAGADDADAVRLAAFFHDAVYDPAGANNEERSAALALELLGSLGVDADRVAKVVSLVRVTASHEVLGADADAAVLCDADLAILAAAPEDYAAYASAVRAEYAHVPDAAFRVGRAQILERLLGRPHLFATAIGRGAWEERARHNIATELVLLRAGA